MNLSWLFGPSIEAHHLLYAYVAVWLIQGGYAAWVALQWTRTRKPSNDNSPQNRANLHQDTRL